MPRRKRPRLQETVGGVSASSFPVGKANAFQDGGGPPAKKKLLQTMAGLTGARSATAPQIARTSRAASIAFGHISSTKSLSTGAGAAAAPLGLQRTSQAPSSTGVTPVLAPAASTFIPVPRPSAHTASAHLAQGHPPPQRQRNVWVRQDPSPQVSLQQPLQSKTLAPPAPKPITATIPRAAIIAAAAPPVLGVSLRAPAPAAPNGKAAGKAAVPAQVSAGTPAPVSAPARVAAAAEALALQRRLQRQGRLVDGPGQPAPSLQPSSRPGGAAAQALGRPGVHQLTAQPPPPSGPAPAYKATGPGFPPNSNSQRRVWVRPVTATATEPATATRTAADGALAGVPAAAKGQPGTTAAVPVTAVPGSSGGAERRHPGAPTEGNPDGTRVTLPLRITSSDNNGTATSVGLKRAAAAASRTTVTSQPGAAASDPHSSSAPRLASPQFTAKFGAPGGNADGHAGGVGGTPPAGAARVVAAFADGSANGPALNGTAGVPGHLSSSSRPGPSPCAERAQKRPASAGKARAPSAVAPGAFTPALRAASGPATTAAPAAAPLVSSLPVAGAGPAPAASAVAAPGAAPKRMAEAGPQAGEALRTGSVATQGASLLPRRRSSLGARRQTVAQAPAMAAAAAVAAVPGGHAAATTAAGARAANTQYLRPGKHKLVRKATAGSGSAEAPAAAAAAAAAPATPAATATATAAATAATTKAAASLMQGGGAAVLLQQRRLQSLQAAFRLRRRPLLPAHPPAGASAAAAALRGPTVSRRPLAAAAVVAAAVRGKALSWRRASPRAGTAAASSATAAGGGITSAFSGRTGAAAAATAAAAAAGKATATPQSTVLLRRVGLTRLRPAGTPTAGASTPGSAAKLRAMTLTPTAAAQRAQLLAAQQAAARRRPAAAVALASLWARRKAGANSALGTKVRNGGGRALKLELVTVNGQQYYAVGGNGGGGAREGGRQLHSLGSVAGKAAAAAAAAATAVAKRRAALARTAAAATGTAAGRRAAFAALAVRRAVWRRRGLDPSSPSAASAAGAAAAGLRRRLSLRLPTSAAPAGSAARVAVRSAASVRAAAASRILAKARMRRAAAAATLARGYCPEYCRTGVCPRAGKTGGEACPHSHDPAKVAVCARWLGGSCTDPRCPLQHRRLPDLMPLCSYFLQGKCTAADCPYLHKTHAPNAPICRRFLSGHCPRGAACPGLHLTTRMARERARLRGAGPGLATATAAAAAGKSGGERGMQEGGSGSGAGFAGRRRPSGAADGGGAEREGGGGRQVDPALRAPKRRRGGFRYFDSVPDEVEELGVGAAASALKQRREANDPRVGGIRDGLGSQGSPRKAAGGPQMLSPLRQAAAGGGGAGGNGGGANSGTGGEGDGGGGAPRVLLGGMKLYL